jgi:3-oxoacyl-[acyl-carrier-protein] synthase-3
MAQFGGPKVEFVKKFPKSFNTDYWPKLMQGALDKAGLTFDDVDHYYFTQLNLRTIEAMMALIGQPIAKTHWVMDKWGYTGSPCVIMALDDAIAQGKGPQPGERSSSAPAAAASRWRRRSGNGQLFDVGGKNRPRILSRIKNLSPPNPRSIVDGGARCTSATIRFA